MAHEVTLIPGDGTGPDLVEATRRVLEATGVEFEWDEELDSPLREGSGISIKPIGFEDRIIDNSATSSSRAPEEYDVIVLPNLYGDIISDLGAGMIGGLGLAPGGSIGTEAAAIAAVIKQGDKVTYDLKPKRDDPSAVGTSEFADAVIEEMN